MVLFGLISKGLEAKEVTLTETLIDWLFVVSGNVFCQMMIEKILLSNGIIVKGIFVPRRAGNVIKLAVRLKYGGQAVHPEGRFT